MPYEKAIAGKVVRDSRLKKIAGRQAKKRAAKAALRALSFAILSPPSHLMNLVK